MFREEKYFFHFVLTYYICFCFCSIAKVICLVLLSNGGKDCAIGDFVKFGGGVAQHHNLSMLEHCLFIGITSC
jgi:hypothetical protein